MHSSTVSIYFIAKLSFVNLTIRIRWCLSSSQDSREHPGLVFFIRTLETSLRSLVAKHVFCEGQYSSEYIVLFHETMCSNADKQMQTFIKAYPELDGERDAWTKVINQLRQ
jgi:hypothetical protein